MTEKEEKYLKSWGSTKQKGKIRFFVLFGVSWGILIPTLVGLIDLLEFSFSEVFLDKHFLIEIVIFTLGGVFILGPLLWYSSNKRYNKLLKKKIDESNS